MSADGEQGFLSVETCVPESCVRVLLLDVSLPLFTSLWSDLLVILPSVDTCARLRLEKLKHLCFMNEKC